MIVICLSVVRDCGCNSVLGQGPGADHQLESMEKDHGKWSRVLTTKQQQTECATTHGLPDLPKTIGE